MIIKVTAYTDDGKLFNHIQREADDVSDLYDINEDIECFTREQLLAIQEGEL